MFKVICTGKNKNYGEKGKVRYLNDGHTLVALKEGWIEGVVIYSGHGNRKGFIRK